LALGRPAVEPLDVAAVVRRVHALLAPVAKADSRRLELAEPLDALGTTAVPGNLVRLTVSAALLAAIDQSTHVVCRVETGDEPRLRVDAADGAPLAMDE